MLRNLNASSFTFAKSATLRGAVEQTLQVYTWCEGLPHRMLCSGELRVKASEEDGEIR